MSKAIVTGHDKKFTYFFRIQQIMQQYYNPKLTTYCIRSIDTKEQFTEHVRYVDFDLPEYLHSDHRQALVLKYQFARSHLPLIVGPEHNIVGWMDADIIPLEHNSLTNFMDDTMVSIAAEQPLNNLVNKFYNSVCTWYGFDGLTGYNSGLVSAPVTHNFWKIWRETIKNLYLTNLNRFFNDPVFYNQDEYQWNIFQYDIPMVLFFVDMVSLNIVIKNHPEMFVFQDVKYNQQPTSNIEDSFTTPRQLPEGTKNFHMLSSYKNCLMMGNNNEQ